MSTADRFSKPNPWVALQIWWALVWRLILMASVARRFLTEDAVLLIAIPLFLCSFWSVLRYGTLSQHVHFRSRRPDGNTSDSTPATRYAPVRPSPDEGTHDLATAAKFFWAVVWRALVLMLATACLLTIFSELVDTRLADLATDRIAELLSLPETIAAVWWVVRFGSAGHELVVVRRGGQQSAAADE